MPRYKIVVITGEIDQDDFHRMLARIFKALTAFQNVAVRFDTYDPDQNGVP